MTAQKPLVFVSHPTANANVRAAVEGFYHAGILSEFQTSIAAFPGDFLYWIGSMGLFRDIRRRSFNPVLKHAVSTRPWMEMGRHMATKTGLSWFVRHEKGIFSTDSVYNDFDKRVAKHIRKAQLAGASAVYAYEDGAATTFHEAKRLGLKCFFDLPIGYWRAAQKYLEQEREKWPEWSSTLLGLQDSKEKLDRKDEELALADQIFVASQFTARTLKEYPGTLAPIKVIPYGFPEVAKERKYEKSKPLKLLFVGGLSQRKGIAYLFDAVEKLGDHVTLTVVGRKGSIECPALNKALSRHRWIPGLPHQEILMLMQGHDVLVFPSLFEGFGLVITEAMSQGTPVITTERTAGPDLINDGENGWIVNAGSSDALQYALDKLITNRRWIKTAGKAAQETAASRPWNVYGEELAATLKKALVINKLKTCS